MNSTKRRLRWIPPALIVIGWLALAPVDGPFMGKLTDVVKNDSSAFTPASAESTQVQNELQIFAKAQVLPAIVVAERGSGITADDRAFVAAASYRVSALPGVSGPLPPSDLSADGQALELVIPIAAGGNPGSVVATVRHDLGSPPNGLTVLVTGPAAQIADLVNAFSGIDSVLLLVAGGFVVLILIAIYRSPLLPLLVVLSAVFALALVVHVVYILADRGILALNGQSQGILFILVFGATTDYSLLLVSRFREQLRDTSDRFDALGLAWRSVLPTIVASSGTVILGVLCLLFSDLQSNKGLGPVAALGIGASLLVSITFLPAVLAIFGRAAFWPLRPQFGSPHRESSALWGRVAKQVGRRPRAVWIGTTALLLLGVAFVPQLKAGGVSQSDLFLTPVDSVTGQRVLARHFPAGSGSPTVIVANDDRAGEVRQASDVAGVTSASVAGSADGRVLILAVLADAPDSEAALRTVQRIRDAVRALPGANAKVGGPSAVQLDTQHTSERDRALIIPIVLVVIFGVLALLLRALLAPVLLIATVVLSFVATLGVSALVFNQLLGFPGADPDVPLLGFVFLVALGIDYNIFLMTRVREEATQSGTRDGTLRGLTLTAGVITSAGLVLAVTFAALTVVPILFLAQIAFIVAFGVLLDTFIVRSLLVPALAIDVGRFIWWPSALFRVDSAGV